jgi:hypothetical protein
MDKVKAFGSFRRGCCAFMDRRGPFPWQDELFLWFCAAGVGEVVAVLMTHQEVQFSGLTATIR